jgi:ketosteroid isomerase-like protein
MSTPVSQPKVSNGRGYGFLELLLVLTVVAALVIIYGRSHIHHADSHAEEHIRDVLTKQVEAWNRGDLAGFMAGYWKSEELTFCSGATITTGWQPTFDRYKKRYQDEGRAMGHLTFEEIHVELLDGDVAFVRGRWKLNLSEDSHGLFTLKFKHIANEWKVVYDHTSAAEPKKKPE